MTKQRRRGAPRRRRRHRPRPLRHPPPRRPHPRLPRRAPRRAGADRRPRRRRRSAPAAGDETIEPMSNIRKVIAQQPARLGRQRRARLDVLRGRHDALLGRCARPSTRSSPTSYGVKASFLPFIMRATVEAIQHWPLVNAELRGTDIVAQAPRQPRRRRLDQRRQGSRRAGHPQRRGAQPARAHARADRPRRARAHEAADGRRDVGRHVLADEPRRLRHALRHADHPAAAGRDHGRERDREAPRGRHRRARQRLDRDPPDHAAGPELRPPPRRRRLRRAVPRARQAATSRPGTPPSTASSPRAARMLAPCER